MKRQIIQINEDLCTGCGLCLPGCPEGAIQLIDGKARLVSDLFCDGLGACLGHCPEGAITIEEREAVEYDERQVMENIVSSGAATIKAHLLHLKEHQQMDYFQQAVEILEEKGITMPTLQDHHSCPGSQNLSFHRTKRETTEEVPSELTHWPIQMHLISPLAAHYQGADLVLAADCVAFAMGSFHNRYLSGKTLAIACPKLDEGREIYLEKLKLLIDKAQINTLTVMIMQVPCCSGLLTMAQEAAGATKRRVPIKQIVVSLQGEVLQEAWL
ncbi:MAG: 4Fe-4S dicluster domain-containing protein [Calditrichaeota bacterium]|nr:MAG: 4Fe-4S dicluster domain-containing protein [Calditrichota bacterium]